METARETKEIKIGAHDLVLKTYLIGREKRALTSVFMSKNLSVSPDGGVSGLDASMVEAAQDAALRIVVVSFDGKKDGEVIEGVDTPFSIVDAILDLKSDEYQKVVSEVNAITNDKDFLAD